MFLLVSSFCLCRALGFPSVRQTNGGCFLPHREGEEWQQIRSILGKHMLKPKEVESYTGTLNEVVSDLIGRLQHQRNLHERHVVKNVADEFYKFGLEGISSVLFESRIGCLEPKVPEETEKFISSINTMFVMTLLTMAMPKFLHQIFPKPWQKFCESWDYMFEFGECLITQGEKVEGKYLTYYLAQEKLSMKSIYGNVTELLLAGVDTISSTLSWSLYELSRHPQIQAAVHEEITTVMQEGLIPTAAEVAQMPLLKAVVKEVLSWYVEGRETQKRPRLWWDSIFFYYRFCGRGLMGTLITLCHYATSRDETYFSDPNSFQPERWLHKNASHHPYASIPFGFGKRSCIGRRIAELEVYLALILMHFEVKPEEEGQIVSPMTRTLLVPDKDINLQFLSR
uniref:Cytochrome P450 family 27 subfamily B member 1 n=1 Tax=Pseudonaja textilis TaxID=8673 RepID=A0A670YKF6_PSETE